MMNGQSKAQHDLQPPLFALLDSAQSHHCKDPSSLQGKINLYILIEEILGFYFRMNSWMESENVAVVTFELAK